MTSRITIAAIGISLAALASPIAIAADADPRAAQAAERTEAMAKLKFMRGTWVGIAKGVGPTGQPYEVTQTERMGPMLNGDIVVVEGRGYAKDGKVAFNAFGVVSYNVFSKAYEFRSYAQGYGGTFPFTLTPTGYVWETPAGPGAVMRFTADVTATTWHEVGDRVAQGKAPERVFEMNLKRTGETEWPAGNPIQP